jgi:glycosyltransferase involved in cell wall biosynthesis
LYLLEAWASGVPVVQPPAASFPELIEETQGGIVADGPTSEALADAIENLLLNEQKRSSLASSARSVVEQRFTSRQMALGFLKEIESVQQNLTIAA